MESRDINKIISLRPMSKMLLGRSVIIPGLFHNFSKLSLSSCHAFKRVQGLRALCTYKSIQTRKNLISSTTLCNDDRVTVHWQNGEQTEYHNVWLRDHCKCEKCFNYSTNQREYDMLYMPLDIKPVEAASNGEELQLTWPDGHKTTFPSQWLEDHTYKNKSPVTKGNWVEPFLWNNKTIASVELPKITHQSILDDDKNLFKVSHAIEKFGFAFVHDTPTDVTGMESLINRLAGFVRETFYGKIWDFSNEAYDYADTAYSASRLEAHSDNTYFADPAGLQLLQCINHNGSGGESLLVDGFNAAEILKKKDYEAFKFLSSQRIPSIYEDNSLCIKSNGPVIELDPYWGDLKQVRFNMYDRDVLDCLPAEDVPRFYHAYQALAKIIRDPGNEFWFKLQPGVCMVMANWRVLHGRNSFTGVRRMLGGYGNKDDFKGQFRSKFSDYRKDL